MPAPNLGLTGAGGLAGMQSELQKIVAERRALEMLNYDREMKQRDFEAKQAAEERRLAADEERNRINWYEAKNPNARAGQFRETKTVNREGKNVIQLYDPNNPDVILREFPDQPDAAGGQGSDFQQVRRQRDDELVAAGKPKMTSEEVETLYDKWRGSNEISPYQKDLAVDRISRQYEQGANYFHTAKTAANQMQVAWNHMQQDPTDKSVPAAAQAIAVYFQKTLDPPSVVREGEYNRSILSESVVNRVLGWAERITKGGVGVPRESLIEYVKLARQVADAGEEREQRFRARAIARAKTVLGKDFDETLLFGEAPPTTARPPQPDTRPAPPPPGGAELAATAGGAEENIPVAGGFDRPAPAATPSPVASHTPAAAGGRQPVQGLQPGEQQSASGTYVYTENADGTRTKTGTVVNGQIVRR